MGPPLVEDFSDVAEYVQEDTSYFEQSASDDELERKIAEEHVKFKEAVARRQEEVRASRPWSAPPVESPRPEQQKERERERQARVSNGMVDLGAARAEYEPPVRTYLLQAQASGNNLSYLSRPQSAEHRAVPTTNRTISNRQSRVSLSGIEEEVVEGTAADSRQPSEVGRLDSSYRGGASTSAGTQDPTAHQVGLDDLTKEGEEEEEVKGLGRHGRSAPGEWAEEQEQEVRDLYPWIRESSAVEVADDADDAASGRGLPAGEADNEEDEERRSTYGQGLAQEEVEAAARGAPRDDDEAAGSDDGVLLASSAGPVWSQVPELHSPSPRGSTSDYGALQPQESGNPIWGVEVTEDAVAGHEQVENKEETRLGVHGRDAGGEIESNLERKRDDGLSSVHGALSVASSSTATHLMAMRGFVEPLPYETSYGADSTGGRPLAPVRTNSYGDDDERGKEREEEEDYAEDTFEEDTEDRGESQQQQQSNDGSLLRSSRSASRALLSSSLRSRDGSSILAPPSRESSKPRSVVVVPPPPVPLNSTTERVSAAGSEVDDGASVLVALSPPPPPPPPPPSLPPIFRGPGSGDGASVASADHLPLRMPQPGCSHSQRSFTSSATGIPVPATPPPPASLTELQPSQQFALQLLKHDIEVLPQHHRAAAEAAAIRRKSATVRPPGTGLASFGYLGFYTGGEELNAPSGPVFRSGSPGRAASPGREDLAGGAPVGNASLKAARSSGPVDTSTAAMAVVVTRRGGNGARPTSAPHVRPSSGASADLSSGGLAADGDVAAVVETGVGFVDLAREMRAGRLLPPVVPPTATRVGRAVENSNGVRPTGIDDSAVKQRNSAPMTAEYEMTAAVTQSRMKFDVWLDALSSGNPPCGGSISGTGGGGMTGPPSNMCVMMEQDRVPFSNATGRGGRGGRGPPRPMTAPASGRRRPNSARPVGGAGTGGIYMPPPAVVNIPKPLTRPLSAQPYHHARPASASVGRTGGVGFNYFDCGTELTVPVMLDTAVAGGTAAVEIGGLTVSVYVADTLKRIVEANRWLQQVGVGNRRYRLKDRFSNMTIQMVEELAPLNSERAGGGIGEGVADGGGGGRIAVVKELTLKQFLSGHAKLRQQAKKLRQAAAVAAATVTAQQQQQVNGGGGGMTGFGCGGGGGGGTSRANIRPTSAPFVGGSGSGAASVGQTAPRTNQMRPASALPFSSSRVAGAADPDVYVNVGNSTSPGGVSATQPGRPMRPNSASTSYGRSAFISYQSGSSPPAALSSPFMHSQVYAVNATSSPGARVPSASRATAAPTAAASGGFPQPRPAWGAPATVGGGGGYPSYHSTYPVTASRNSGADAVGRGLPYMHHSITATAGQLADVEADLSRGAHFDDVDQDSERGMVIEPDERGDVSRAVRQQLGSAADYCQARRQEIARLRTLPLA